MNVGTLTIAIGLWAGVSMRAQGLSEAALSQISFTQKLNSQITDHLSFRNEKGQIVRLGSYFGRRPHILILGYYQCPMLCNLVLNGLVECLEDMKWSIGREFDVIMVSIDPTESPSLAVQKKETYLKRYGRAGAAEGWHFLTGEAPAIQVLASEIGFQYAYDQLSKQYAHPSGFVILTPEGKVARYFFGVTFSPRDVFDALSKASKNQVSSPIKQFVLLCFHYNPITGKYGALIMGIVRALSAFTLVGLLALIWTLARRSSGQTGEARSPAIEGTPTQLRDGGP